MNVCLNAGAKVVSYSVLANFYSSFFNVFFMLYDKSLE